MAGHLLADDDPADGGRDDSRRRVGSELVGKPPADLRGDGGILQQQRALKELPAMQARAKNKVTVQKGSGPAKKIKDVVHMLIRKIGRFFRKFAGLELQSLSAIFAF